MSSFPGASDKLHTHFTEQIPIVIEGKEIVATKEQECMVTLGMIIFDPPGEEHWHGTTKDSSFAHVSIIGQLHEFEESGKIVIIVGHWYFRACRSQ
jgi:quercetin dioxygenase-like cupin family protein